MHPVTVFIERFMAAVSVLIGPCCSALLESYSRKCAYCCIIAKFHYTDTDTDPNGPARTQRSFAAKKSVSVSVSGPCRARVVEFSSYPTTCVDFVRVGPVSVSVSV